MMASAAPDNVSELEDVEGKVNKVPTNGVAVAETKEEREKNSWNEEAPTVGVPPTATAEREVVPKQKNDKLASSGEKTDSTKAMEKALNLDEGDEETQCEKLSFEGVTPEIGGRAKWLERQREREEKNKRLSKQKDGSYFSYMFLEKIFRESRKCKACNARDSGKPLTDDESSLELYVSEKGVVGRQRIICSECGAVDPVISCETMAEIPDKPEYRIDGSTVRYYCKKVTHYEVLHDLMELLHIAALENDKSRQQKHLEIAEFMLHNAPKVCKEWCRPESTELRNKRFLRLREETLLTRYKPVFTADHTEEYKEMYGMMAGSFRQHREKVKLLLELLKVTLFDSPTYSSFMLWVAIAMTHSETYQKFKALYDPKTFMLVDSTEYHALRDRYLALNVALGIKKIPIVFVLFELPRFYQYIEFLKERVGKERPTSFLLEEERRSLEKFDRQSHKYSMKRKVKSGKIVSVESHLDMLTQREEFDREMIHRNTQDSKRAKQLDRRQRKQMKKASKERLALESSSGKMSSQLKDDERVSSGGCVVQEISESLDDLERKHKEAEEYFDYMPPFLRRRMEHLRDRTSLEKDMVAEMIIRQPYKSRFELLLEEEERLWGMDGNWSRKDVLLTEEDMMFERKVSLRLNKPENSVAGTVPVCINLSLGTGSKIPTQGQILALFDKLFSEDVDPISFDCACDKIVQMRQREASKKSVKRGESGDENLQREDKEESKKNEEVQNGTEGETEKVEMEPGGKEGEAVAVENAKGDSKDKVDTVKSEDNEVALGNGSAVQVEKSEEETMEKDESGENRVEEVKVSGVENTTEEKDEIVESGENEEKEEKMSEVEVDKVATTTEEKDEVVESGGGEEEIKPSEVEVEESVEKGANTEVEEEEVKSEEVVEQENKVEKEGEVNIDEKSAPEDSSQSLECVDAKGKDPTDSSQSVECVEAKDKPDAKAIGDTTPQETSTDNGKSPSADVEGEEQKLRRERDREKEERSMRLRGERKDELEELEREEWRRKLREEREDELYELEREERRRRRLREGREDELEREERMMRKMRLRGEREYELEELEREERIMRRMKMRREREEELDDLDREERMIRRMRLRREREEELDELEREERIMRKMRMRDLATRDKTPDTTSAIDKKAEEETDEECDETHEELKKELNRVLDQVNWDQSPETQEALEQMKMQEFLLKPSTNSGASAVALLDILKRTTSSENVPIHRINLNPDTNPPTKEGQSKNLSAEDEKLVHNIADLCWEYMQDIPTYTGDACALSTPIDRLNPNGEIAMLTHVSDNVVVAIVTCQEPDDESENAEGSIVPLEDEDMTPSKPEEQCLDGKEQQQQQEAAPPKMDEEMKSRSPPDSESSRVLKRKFSDRCIRDRVDSEEVLEKTSEMSADDLAKSQSEYLDEDERTSPVECVVIERADVKKEKKMSRRKNKRIEKKAKQLVEAVQKQKAMEDRLWQRRMLKRTPSEEAFERLMEKKDCTLDQLTMEEKHVLMNHVRKQKEEQYYRERRMLSPGYKPGTTGVRDRLRQKLFDRRMDEDYYPSYKSSYSKKTEEKYESKSSDPPKSKRKSRRSTKADSKSESQAETKSKSKGSKSLCAAPVENETKELKKSLSETDSEKMVEVKEKLGMDADMPKMESMKSKVSDPPKLEQEAANESPATEKVVDVEEGAVTEKMAETETTADTEKTKETADTTDVVDNKIETTKNAPEDKSADSSEILSKPVTSTDPKVETEAGSEAPPVKPTPPSTNSAIHHKSLEMTMSAKVPPMTMPKQLAPPSPEHEQRVVSVTQFRSLLVDHLKANEEAEQGKLADISSVPAAPKMRATVSARPHGKQPEPTMSLPATPAPAAAPPLKLNKKQRKDAKKLLRKQQRQLLVAQVDTQLLREQGFKVKEDSTTTTVICNTDGGIEEVLHGVETPEQIKEFLGGRYNVVSKGTGYLSVPGDEESEDSEPDSKPTKSLDATKPKLETARCTTWDVDSDSESGDGLSGFPLTSKWQKEKRDKLKKVLMKGLGKAIPIEQPPALRKKSPPRDELEELEVVEEPEVNPEDKEKEEKKAKKRQRRNDRKRAEKLKKEEEEEKERLKAEAEKKEEKQEEEKGEKKEEESAGGEPTEVKDSTSETALVLHKQQKPQDPPLNPDVFEVPIEDLGLTPLMLTNAPSYITLDDMEDIEAGRENSSPGGFVYRVSIANGGDDHPFKDIYQFARKRQSDLNVMVVVSEIICSRNHEDILCLESKPGRVSYNCQLKISELHAPYGKDPMSATLQIRPGYPNLSTLNSLFNEGPVSFAKLAAEAARRPPKKPYQFDFGVSTDDPDLCMSAENRKKIATFLGTEDHAEVQRVLKKEFAKSVEADKKTLLKKMGERRKKLKVKKIPDKSELKVKAKNTSEKNDDTTVSPTGPPPEEKSKSTSLPATIENSDVTAETTKPDAAGDTTDKSTAAADGKSKSRKTARDKFRRCENCEQEILERIQLCAGCKKVAYCNIRCQKSHWKQHKKSCTYAPKQSEKVHHCESCNKEMVEKVLMCAGCKKVAYCNRSCQKSHWKQHKKMCTYAQKKDTKQ